MKYFIAATHANGKPLTRVRIEHDKYACSNNMGITCMANDLETHTGEGGITLVELSSDQPHFFIGECVFSGELRVVKSIEHLSVTGKYYSVDLTFNWQATLGGCAKK